MCHSHFFLLSSTGNLDIESSSSPSAVSPSIFFFATFAGLAMFFAAHDSHPYQCTCAHAKDELSFCAHVPTHRMVRPSRPIGPTARAAFIAPVHAVYTSAAGRYMGIDPCPK